MTLTNKLALSVLGLLLLIFMGTFLITMNNTRNYFYTQLQHNAADTARVLSLSMSQSQFLTKKDMQRLGGQVKAVLDASDFSSITVIDLYGNTLIEKENKMIKDEEAPQWFNRLLNQPIAAEASLIMKDGHPIGTVSVRANPHLVHQALWKNAQELLKAYLFFSFIILLCIAAFTHWLLGPLKRLKAQALAIRANTFPIETQLPKAREFREVTLAMNTMAKRMKAIFSEQTGQIENLRKEAYQDKLTKVANRQFFLQQLHGVLGNEEEFVPGLVMIISIDGLYGLYKRGEKKAGDALARGVAKICVAYWDSQVFRISGNNFTIIIHQDTEMFQKTSKRFYRELQQLEKKTLETHNIKIIIGSVFYQLHQSKSALLGELDKALQDSRSRDGNIAYRGKSNDFERLVLDILDLESALMENRLILYSQAVLNEKKEFHRELFVRLNTLRDGEISAGYFMPYALKIHMSYLIDDFVLSQAIEKLGCTDHILALNLSLDTLINPKNRKEYLEKLASCPLKTRQRIHIEINESVVLSHFSEVQSFFEELRQLQVKRGIDQFGLHFSSLYYLNELPLAYVKLHGSLIRDMNQQGETLSPAYFYKITKTLGIEVIATQVERREQWKALQEMSIRWGQGIYLDSIRRLEEL